MPPPNGTCGSHDGFEKLFVSGLASIKELFESKFDSFAGEINRRLDESAKDRVSLHEKTNALQQEVTRAMTRLNGANLVGYSPKDRRSDKVSGKLKEDWKLYLLVVIISAMAGEKLIPFVLKLFGLTP